MSKAKPKSDAFAFVRSLFGSSASKPSELKIERRKADEEVLDRVASVSLSLAEHFAPLAVSTQDPQAVTLALGAVREARECVRARKEVTGGGLAGGTQTSTGVTVLIEHSGEYVSEDFHDRKSPNESSIPVQTGSSPKEQ